MKPPAMPNTPLRILIFHGYLLAGTGSNVYNAQLAKALLELGHEVHLFSQDRHPERYEFLDAAADWDGGSLRITRLRAGERRCTVYRPDIGGLLPVYVEDRYEGVEARSFDRCSEAEVRSYLRANVAAVSEVAALVEPQLALANHLVMGPAILSRALAGGAPFAVKVHGSALEYTVKRDPERFLPYAREGLAAARAVLTGSRHTADSLFTALGEHWVAEHRIAGRTGLGPPGVDVRRFVPRSGADAAAGVRRLRARLAADADEARATPGGPRVERDAFARDEDRAAAALAELDSGSGPIVAFVGKLIISKGIDLLLAAWPLVLAQVPSARLVVVGFGAFQDGIERLLVSLADGDLEALFTLAAAGRELEGGPRAPLRHLTAFLRSLRGEDAERYLRSAQSLPRRVVLTGRLEHGELAELLPACEALVVPSTFPEAFGMVAAEAAACGALPISAAHSGLAEVAEELRTAVPDAVGGLLSFPVDDAVVPAIAVRVSRWLALDREAHTATREGIVACARELWSWRGAALRVIAAAQGEVRPISPEWLHRWS
jgi:glycosyltransferase involved in cell wall biosynthesis